MELQGHPEWLSGVEVGVMVAKGETTSVEISQRTYSQDIFEEVKMATANAVSVPIDKTLTEDETEEICNLNEYQCIIGKLIYLQTMTRPDLAYAVSQAARFMSKPKQIHHKAVKRLLRYLKGSQHLGIRYYKSEATASNRATISGYSDASYGDLL